jgi:hypothetical protein
MGCHASQSGRLSVITNSNKSAALGIQYSVTTKARTVEIRAFAWNEGEEPVELVAGSADDFNKIEHTLMTALETKDWGKLVRYYPPQEYPPMPAGELALTYRTFTDPFRGRQIAAGTDLNEVNKRFEEMKQFCTQRVFSPAELYALKPVRIDSADWRTINVHLMNEVSYWDMDHDAAEAANRMETRTLVDHDYDGRRGWTLQTVWFDNVPVMVVNSSGRDGDEYHDRWITDLHAFGKMVAWLRTFVPPDDLGYAEADAKIPAMTEFYNHTIHEYYNVEAQEPKKK